MPQFYSKPKGRGDSLCLGKKRKGREGGGGGIQSNALEKQTAAVLKIVSGGGEGGGGMKLAQSVTDKKRKTINRREGRRGK